MTEKPLTLEEYAARHGAPQAPQDAQSGPDIADAILDRRHKEERLKELQTVILTALERGDQEASIIWQLLELALLFTGETDWMEATRAAFEKRYPAAQQEAIFEASSILDAQRIRDQRRAYNEKTKKQLREQLKAYKKIETGLENALKALNEIDLQAADNLPFD